MIRVTKPLHLVDTETGEAIVVPAGSNVNLPDELRKKKIILREKEKNTASEEWFSKNCGDFFWKIFSDNQYKISGRLFVEILYLISYLGYDTNILFIKGKPMRKKDVQKIMNSYGKNYYLFWSKVLETGIIKETEDLSLTVLPEYKKGLLKSEGLSATKVFIQPLRQLYKNLYTTDLSYLAYAYRLIPHTNVYYNIVCKNPFEFEKEKINPMSFREICEILGANVKNQSRISKKMRSITFIDKNGKEKHIVYMTGGRRKSVYINPQLFSSCIKADNLVEMEERFVTK